MPVCEFGRAATSDMNMQKHALLTCKSRINTNVVVMEARECTVNHEEDHISPIPLTIDEGVLLGSVGFVVFALLLSTARTSNVREVLKSKTSPATAKSFMTTKQLDERNRSVSAFTWNSELFFEHRLCEPSVGRFFNTELRQERKIGGVLTTSFWGDGTSI